MTLVLFSGDTSGTGAEDDSSITGTLTFTDAIDGDSALTFTVSSDASNGSIRRRQWCLDVRTE